MKRQREAADASAARQAEIASLMRRQGVLTTALAARREEKAAASAQLRETARRIEDATAAIDAMGAAMADMEGAAHDEARRMAALRGQLGQAAAQNKRQLAATLRGVQLLRGADGPDPKLLSMSQLHMLGEVLSALFERLHTRDAEAGGREDALCELLRAHGIPLPPVPERVHLATGDAPTGGLDAAAPSAAANGATVLHPLATVDEAAPAADAPLGSPFPLAAQAADDVTAVE